MIKAIGILGSVPLAASLLAIAATAAAAPCVPCASTPGGSLLLDASPQTARGNSHLIIISGLSGEQKYRDFFRDWALILIDAAEGTMGVAPASITYLAEEVEVAPQRVDGRSTAETIEATLRDLSSRAAPGDRIAIVLIGHGSARNGESRINLPGPDLTAADFARLLDLFPRQTIALVNTASASGDFVAALSGSNRAIITATRDGRQDNETVFAGYFVQAYSQDGADLDKDERVSLLEAYEYAVREVQRFYDDSGRLRTETALLDDNGDAEGSHEPDPAAGDGSLARGFFLAGSPVGAAGQPAGAESDDPELRALHENKISLEQRIEELRRIKETMDPEVYMTELEALLVDLALTERAIREKGGGTEGGAG